MNSRFNCPRCCRFYVLLCLLLSSLCCSAQTREVKLVWTASPDTNVIGYNIYVVYDCSTGTNQSSCTNIVDVGSVTSAIITGLAPNTTYSFAATAYDWEGDESAFSNWLVYTTPLQLSLGTWPTIDLPAMASSNIISGWHETNFYILLTNNAPAELYRFGAPRVINSTNQP